MIKESLIAVFPLNKLEKNIYTPYITNIYNPIKRSLLSLLLPSEFSDSSQ